jgi:hypothetical protein
MFFTEIIMPRDQYCYTFNPDVPSQDVEITLLLALVAVESLHGETQASLDAEYRIDVDRRTCIVGTATPVGRDLNRLFAGFARREYGESAFRVERVGTQQPETAGAH